MEWGRFFVYSALRALFTRDAVLTLVYLLNIVVSSQWSDIVYFNVRKLKSRKEIDLTTINEMDIPPLENGIYFIELVIDEQQWIAKWVRWD